MRGADIPKISVYHHTDTGIKTTKEPMYVLKSTKEVKAHKTSWERMPDGITEQSAKSVVAFILSFSQILTLVLMAIMSALYVGKNHYMSLCLGMPEMIGMQTGTNGNQKSINR